MPAKGYKSIAIKEELFKEIKQKAGSKSVSLYLEQVVKGGKDKEEGGKEVVTISKGEVEKLYEAIENLRKDIASLRDTKKVVIGGKREVVKGGREEKESSKQVVKDIPIQKKEIENKEVTDKYSRFKPFEPTKKEKVIPARPL